MRLFFQLICRAARDDNIGAVLCKQLCCGRTDAGSTAGDNGDPSAEVMQIGIHLKLLLQYRLISNAESRAHRRAFE